MLNRSPLFVEASEQDGAKVSVLARLTVSTLAEQVRSLSDWEEGEQITSSPPETTTTEDISIGETDQWDVVSTEFFEVTEDSSSTDPIRRDISYLRIEQGGNFEIVSYDLKEDTNFQQITRGLFGSTEQAFTSGATIKVHTVDYVSGVTTDLGIQPRHWWRPDDGVTTPAQRGDHTLIWAASISRWILFGGRNPNTAGSPIFYSDIWLLDPATDTWLEKTPAAGPTARWDHGAVWDSNRDVMIIHGGTIEGGGPQGTDVLDTWEWNPVGGGGEGVWTSKLDGPQTRSEFAHGWRDTDNTMIIAFGSQRNNMYKFDGDANTWTRIDTETFPQSEVTRGQCNIVNGIMLAYSTNFDRVYILDTIAGTRQSSSAPPFPTAGRQPIRGVAVNELTGEMMLMWTEDNSTQARIYFYSPGGDFFYRVTNYQFISSLGFDQFSGLYPAWDNTNYNFASWGGIASEGGFTPEADADDGEVRYFRDYYEESEWESGELDLGSVPVTNGRFIADDTSPFFGTTVIEYTLLSATISGGPYTDRGVFVSGQEITDLDRFWKVRILLQTNSNDSPRVQRARISFDTTRTFCLNDAPVFGYEPIINRAPGQSTKMDTLKGTASIGTFTLELLNEGDIAADLIRTGNIYNQPVELFLGFIYPGFTENDYMPYLYGLVKEWSFDGKVVKLNTWDGLLELKKKIPSETGTTSKPAAIPYGPGSGILHPINIQLDMIQNHANVNDTRIDLDSFTNALNHASLAGWVLDRTLTEPEEAKKYLEEISRLTGFPLIVSPDGRVKIIIVDETVPTVATFDETNITDQTVDYRLMDDNLRNIVVCYFDGEGNSIDDYIGVRRAASGTSITKWNKEKTERIFPNWLGEAGGTTDGDLRAEDISQRIRDLFKDAVPEIVLGLNLDFVHLEVGDSVLISGGALQQDYTIPYLGEGIDLVRDMRFLIVSKKVSPSTGKVKLNLWRGSQFFTELIIDSQAEWEAAIL